MALEWTAEQAAGVLRMPTASDDKYSRGVLGVRTGSDRYPGAAVLGVEAAHRTGLGMVRYLGDERPTALVLARRPETVTADGRVQAWLIGSGTDASERSGADTAARRELLAGSMPVVVDAGALDLVPGAVAPVVVSPHDRELARLREAAGLPEISLTGPGADREGAAVDTAAALGVTVLLKGSRTVVATPAGRVRTVVSPTAWLAAAGTGDVLGGILGALVAGAAGAAEADAGADGSAALDADTLGALAATAAYVHGHAAAAASAARSGGPIAALDVAGSVASVIGTLLAR
ncbi:NAD(P)H-hydrate dehydratase [Microbacterium sp. F2E]|uniref:ADP-dependent NAD(P)H-hydrate dehydratase n=1 Tax=Microbacterium sp. F2E TaxID=2895284 RepID=UPI001E58AD18|nr:ADP/ATP-dependent (S)-NAD(P)H-hydrate dehydratase [Microbacterium sp. F2E]MCC9053718.1 NAD(P)H-hydrate dehydratase [Microbacterium sp. F2E]